MTGTLSPNNKTTLNHSVLTSNPTHRQNPRSSQRRFRAIVLMLLVTVLLLGGIGGRLGYLQLVQGEHNRELAENFHIRIQPRPPVRGNILDRNGNILADTRLAYSVYVWPRANTEPNWDQTRARLADILNMDPEKITHRVRVQKQSQQQESRVLIPIARDLTPEQVTAIQEYRHELERVELAMDPVRDYPHGSLAAHVIGYTDDISQQQWEQKQKQGYRKTDIIGQAGAEAAFESRLRGEWGGQKVEVKPGQIVVEVLGEKEAKSGENITLTLDLELQKAAEAALGEQTGAIVALDPNNGEVLAMASQPNFDPNMFSSTITQQRWDKFKGKNNPLLNRALQGFPPASTFKIVTGTSGLESGEYPPDTTLKTYPFLNISGIRIWEWNRAGFGSLGYVGAFANSSNTFFGQIGRGVGQEVLIDWARQYGFGEETEIELPSEKSGLIPTPEWKKKHDYPSWSVADTVNMSLGQGLTLATPLQVAVMFAVPANGGDRVQPHLLKTEKDDSQWKTSMDLNQETLNILQKGLRQVVVRGTGTALNVPSLPPVAGKTGTAEILGPTSHAWFGGYAPNDNPEIVVVGFAEDVQGGGGSVAAPIVKQVMQAYFQDN